MRSSSRPTGLSSLSCVRHVALALLLFGCGSPAAPASSSVVPLASVDGPGCRLTDGTTATRGTVAPSTDGTNTCTCGPTHWSCTELPFHPAPTTPPPSAGLRADDGITGTCTTTDATIASVGTHLPSDDGCNTCTCGPEGWVCTELACPE